MGRDDIIGHAAHPAPCQYRIIVLLRQGRLDVVLRNAFHLHCRLAKSHPVRVGKALNVVHVLGIQPALFHEYCADRTAAILWSILALHHHGPIGNFVHLRLLIKTAKKLKLPMARVERLRSAAHGHRLDALG